MNAEQKTTLPQLLQHHIVSAMSFYVANDPNETEQDESVVYFFAENSVCFEKNNNIPRLKDRARIDPRKKIFYIKVSELIAEKALTLIPDWHGERHTIKLNDLDALIIFIIRRYEDFLNKSAPKLVKNEK